MSAKFELSASEGGTLQVIQQVTGAIDKVGTAAEGAVKSTRQLNAEAQRIKEGIDPQEKLNRKFAEWQQLVDAGKISIGQMTAAGIKLRQEMYAASAEGKAAAAAEVQASKDKEQSARDAAAKEKSRIEQLKKSLDQMAASARQRNAAEKRGQEEAAAAAAKTKREREAATAQLEREKQQIADAAQKVREWISPQEKLNAKYRELGQLVKAGELSMADATKAGVKYRQELGLAAQEQEKGFGSQAVSSVTMMAARYASVAAAIGLIVSGLKEKTAEEERAAQRVIQSRAGMGSLSQLAAGEGNTKEERQAAFARLVAEARGYVAMGAVADENEAGNLTFQLAGAGLDEKDRMFAAKIKAAGTLSNVGGAAESYSALKTSLGEAEVGTFQEFMSKSLRAAGPAPGSFEQLPIAAAQSGGSAKALGVNDEFLLAATTILGKQSGSISEGGTQLAAFLRGVEKSGVSGVEGVGGMGIIDKLASLPTDQQGLGGVLGDRAEAVQAFRTLRDNRGELEKLLSGVTAAQSENLAGEAAGIPDTDDQLFAARTAEASKRREELASNAASSADRNLLNSMRSDRQRALYEQGRTTDAAFERGVSAAGDWIPGFGWAQEQGLIAGAEVGSDETRELMRRQTEATERLERGARSKVTTQQE